MAKQKQKQLFLLKPVVTLIFLIFTADVASATWCVARSDASEEALLTALNYACGSGADCEPIQSNGLCYLPNTVLAHASYAFNSYYQRRGNAPDSCTFAGTATVARTDPSYGSCVYPSSPSTAGGTVGQGGTPVGTTTPGTNTTPTVSAPPSPGTSTPLDGSTGGLNPGFGPVLPEPPRPNASPDISVKATLSRVIFLFVLVLCECIVGNLSYIMWKG